MRIAFIIPYFYPAWEYGGSPRAAYELARGLAGRGHHVRVLTTDSGGRRRIAAGSREVDGIEVYYFRNLSNYLAFRYRLFGLPPSRWKFARHLAGCDLVHVHELRSTLAAATCFGIRNAGIPYVLSPHGGLAYLGRGGSKRVFDILWGRRLLNEAASVVAASPVEADDAVRRGIPEDRVTVVPNAVSPEACRRIVPGAFRKRYGIDRRYIVLFLGRLHVLKGADILVRAVARLLERRSDVQLVLAGPDDGAEADLKAQVRAAGLDSGVLWTGFLDEDRKFEALTDADLTVVPSRSEVFAIVAVESLLCETPALVSSVCGLSPFPGEEKGVFRFESEDVADLAVQLEGILGSEERRARAAEGRRFVEGAFSPAVIAEQMEHLYREALDRWRSRGQAASS